MLGPRGYHVIVNENVPVLPKHAPAAVMVYVPDIEAPEMVPVKLPIPGEFQLIVTPLTVPFTMGADEKHGEPDNVMLPENVLTGCGPGG